MVLAISPEVKSVTPPKLVLGELEWRGQGYSASGCHTGRVGEQQQPLHWAVMGCLKNRLKMPGWGVVLQGLLGDVSKQLQTPLWYQLFVSMEL